MRTALLTVVLSATLFGQTINLPSSKKLEPVPGSPQKLSSFPSKIVVSPDGRYAAILNQGYGTTLSEGHQSIAIYDIDKMQLRDFPDARLGPRAQQTYYLGLAFSSKGDEIYASMASLTDPEGKKKGSTGNGIAVYSFHEGQLVPERFLKIPLQSLAAGKRFTYGDPPIPPGKAIPYPAGLAVVPADPEHRHERLLVADNLSDNAVLMDAVTGEILHTFDLSTKDFVPAAFPHSVVVAPDGKRAWVSLWNSATVAEIDLVGLHINRHQLAPETPNSSNSPHASFMTFDPNRQAIYVGLANKNEVMLVGPDGSHSLVLSLPAGAYPSSLAVLPNSNLLLSASGVNAIYEVPACLGEPGCKRSVRRYPTQWYPTAIATRGDDVLIANGKGIGTGPNNGPVPKWAGRREFPYVASLLNGSLQHTRLSTLEAQAKGLDEQVVRSNRLDEKPVLIEWNAKVAAKISAKLRARGPIRHVIYIVKENRTYDQVFGDLGVGNGDKSLTMYGWDITPNQHKLALQFGVLDNFYDSGEVSGDGHDWTMAAITSDYTERNWQIEYRGGQRSYDYEGQVGGHYPLEQGIPDINEPGTGFLWGLVARNHRTYRHYGEFISTEWCKAEEWENSPATTGTQQTRCSGPTEIKKGESLPANVGDPKGGPSPWPWPVPTIARNVPTKPELVGHFDPNFPDFKMDYPDQLRVDEFLNEFEGFVRARRNGQRADEMPELIVLRLPNDHTAGTSPGMPAPIANVADNDLAVGRVVEAISHSAYWDDTAILILEDDAQDGPDHVDAHRSLALLISKYSPSSTQKPYLESGFYTTVNMIRTLEDLLGLPCMNINDCHATPISRLFKGAGTQVPFTADRRNLENGMLYLVNPPRNKGAATSMKLDFSHADAANAAVLNRVLWQDRKGDVPMPAPKHSVIHELE
jgi:DNA-binding beta-propeller fold protein YncE